MNTIKDLIEQTKKNSKIFDVEIKATVVSVGDIRTKWKCYSCKQEGWWFKNEEKKCPNCGATENIKKIDGDRLVTFSYQDLVIDDGTGRGKYSLVTNSFKSECGKYDVGDVIQCSNAIAELATWTKKDGTIQEEFRLKTKSDLRKIQ